VEEREVLDAAAVVVALAGRRIDAAGAPERFPLGNRVRVRDAIASMLAARPVSALVCSAACGADLLALEAAASLGIRSRVILPFSEDRFRTSSVMDRPGDWGPLFDRVMTETAARGDLVVLECGEGDSAYAIANQAILAEGEALAADARAARVALIAWDGAPRAGGDLTDDFRTEAIGRGWLVEEVLTR
jgi:hypothetical protein